MNLKDYKRKIVRLCAVAMLTMISSSVMAQTYTYKTEDFEDAAWATKGTSVTSATGKWTTNNNVSDQTYAKSGTNSLLLAKKAGVTLPELTEGAGTLIYYSYSENRMYYVETSTDGTTWTAVETEKLTSTWIKHIVSINDAAVKYVRIRTTSNNQFYIDDVLLTKPDGTDGDGNMVASNLRIPYFTQTFEQLTDYPQDKTTAATETTYNVEGQGEWIYLNAYAATNTSYITDGSAHSLRMLKGSSYVITPVLSQGVVSLTFNEGRTGKKLSVYISTDSGETWTLLREITTEITNTLAIGDTAVNRLKIANETTKGDVDVDNITVTAYPKGTPATLTTGEAVNITPSSADVSGVVTDSGDKRLIEYGVCWSVEKEQPTIDDNTVTAEQESFTVTLKDMPADTKVYARAYAVGLAGIGYGNVVSFTTLAPELAAVITTDVTEDDFADEQYIYVLAGGEVSDNGGSTVTEVGVCYGTAENPDTEGQTVKCTFTDGKFSTSIALNSKTKYYFRAYAVNAVGTSYGEQKEYTTGEIIVPEYAHNVYYCDPLGNDSTADGSVDKPFYSLQNAVDIVVPGDTIYMNAGTYAYGSRINISTIGAANSGMIVIKARNGRAILDFSQMALADANQGIRLTGSYWYLYGLDICGAGDNGLLIERNKPSGGSYSDIAARTDEGHDNIVELCNFYRNQDTGLQMKNLAEYNKVINCDSYFNADPDMGDADGFAVKLSHGTGNYFYGCRAWNNSDDGWDQFIKKDGGFPDDITTTLDCCWAFNNGYLEDGTAGSGNGNGFKMGSNQGRNNVILNRCMAFNNLQKGFDQNHNTGNMILNNCTGYAAKDDTNSSHYTYRLEEEVAEDHEIRLTNCVAISDGITDRKKSAYAIHSVTGSLVTSDLNTLPADYKSIDPTGTDCTRLEDGSLPVLDFMRIAEGNTKLIDTGTPVAAYSGESRYSVGITYNGTAPDLGCFETESTTGLHSVMVSERGSDRLSVSATQSGLLLVTLNGASAATEYRVALFDASGRVLTSHLFNGSTTAITLPSFAAGMLLVKVTGDDVNESRKVMVR